MTQMLHGANTVTAPSLHGAGTVPAPYPHGSRTVSGPSPQGVETRSTKRLRRCQVGVRLTPEENACLNELAAQAGLSAADYCRRSALGGHTRLRAPPISGSRRRIEHLRALVGQAANIRSALHQLAQCSVTATQTSDPINAALHKAAAELHALRADIRHALGVQGVQGVQEKPPCL